MATQKIFHTGKNHRSDYFGVAKDLHGKKKMSVFLVSDEEVDRFLML